MKTQLFLALGLALSLSSAQAAVDNSVEINLSATVGRSCVVDLAPADQASSLTTSISDIQIQLPPRAEEGSMDTKTVTIYETCNEAFQINVKSLQGGLKHAQSDYLHVYGIRYPDQFGGASPYFQSNSFPHTYNRDLAIWRGQDENRTEGMTPYFEPQTLLLSFPQSANLPKGDYSDTITVEMATVE